jgi:hypothetical protein
VPEPGRYRLITEFLAEDEGGNPDHLVLGDERVVGGTAADQPVPVATMSATVDDLTVKVHGAVRSGPDSAGNRMRLGVSLRGEAADLGTYLGVSAHVTAFAVTTGAMVHTHPLGPPVSEGDEAVLTFHTAFPAAGDYRMFVQVRVSGIVRTVPITIHVA